MNSPPPMDDLERALERLSESPNEPTQLWRRALDVARAEERDSLVHPKSHRDGDRSGRRLLIGLNAIGVAAMLALASGVWWMAMHPERARTAGRGSGIDTFSMTPNQQATTTPEPMELALADEQAEPDLVRNVPPTEFRAGSGFEIDEAAPADVDSSDTAMPKELETAARSRRAESQRSDRIAALEMANTTGDARMEPADQGLMSKASAPEPGETVETVELTIEVADPASAFVAISSLPDAAFDEFGDIPEDTTEDGARVLTLNIRPERVPAVIESIGRLGHIQHQHHRRESRAERARADLNLALEALRPGLNSLDEVLGDGGEPMHHRELHGLDRPERAPALEVARTSLRRALDRLEAARQSMDLSRIRVEIHKSPAER